jgi:thiamine pyrophosphate-dependent acetolactate synthase large subunit-like protein
MNRKKAIQIIAKTINDQPIISANGFISRELFNTYEKKSNFYMLGSMGLASSIGLGVALRNPKKTVYVFDGDGNILMNLGSMTTIGTIKPKNLVHIIFDNSIHESTGGQPTNSKKIDLGKIAQCVNYKTFVAQDEKELEKIMKNIKFGKGPILLKIKISKTTKIEKRISIEPTEIRSRFQKSII